MNWATVRRSRWRKGFAAPSYGTHSAKALRFFTPSAAREPCEYGPEHRFSLCQSARPSTEMNPSFWRHKRVLVTGHTGFKGSWLCLLLNSFGAKVAGYALSPPTNPNLYSAARVGELVETTLSDIRDLEPLAAYVAAVEPEIVFHMAAQSVVLQSYADPVETYSSNVLGTVHTLEAIRRARRASRRR